MGIISMAGTNFYVYAIFVFLLTWLATHLLLKSKYRSKHHNLPPGPTQIPIFGNLLQLGSTPHRRLAELASTHGSLMTIRLYTRTTVVVSDAAAVRDVFSLNDHSLSNRRAFDANTALNHDKLSVIWLPNGSTWRHLRKIFASNLFSSSSLDLGRHLRERKVADLLSFVERCSVVNINDCVFNLTLNIMSNAIFSMDLADPSSPISKKFKEVIIGISVVSGKPNLTDFFPFLRVFDPQGIRRSVEHYFKEMMSLIDGLIADRLAGKLGVPPESEQDMLGVLLKFSRDEESEITRAFISHIIMDLFITGTDTTASTIEYAMAELIKNQNKMQKLREELDGVIGRKNPVQESDISKLPYLQAVIKETLRLHPPIPLSTRQPLDTDISARGFTIPKGTRVTVNIWAVGRDPSVWPNPLSFEPERHVGSESDYKNKNFEIIPFGIGRRSCPGYPLVLRTVPLVLGSLIHSFDWKLEGDATSKNLDFGETVGFTSQKSNPLYVIPVKI